MGVRFAIATGRMYGDVELFLKENDLKCQCILMNGAEYRDEEANILKSIDIHKDKVIQILDNIKKYSVSAQIYTSEGVFTTSNKEEALIGMAYRIQAFEPETPMKEAIEMAKVDSRFINLKYITNINDFLNSGVNIGKIIIFYDDIDILKKLNVDLEALGELAMSSSFPTCLEINNIDAQKGHILAKVIEDMEVKRDEVMVIGDSLNDYSMFEQFNISFAMGNARSEIKQIAKYITDTNDNAGVAKAIYKVLDEEI